MSIFRLQTAALAFGHVPLLDDAELTIESRERLCLVGRNGTGKSTLMKVIAGQQALDSGQRWESDALRIAKLEQEVPLGLRGTTGTDATLFETVARGLGDHAELLKRYHDASALLDNATEQELVAFSRLQEEIEQAGAWEGTQAIDATLHKLKLNGDALMSECSGGVRRRAMLGQALVSAPDLLLLDEPTYHLNIESITVLEEALIGIAGTVLFITHDRSFIDNMATRIIELDRGILRSYPGDYSTYLKRREAELSAEADANRKFDQNLAEEEVWIRQGIKARRTRNEGRVRRLEALRSERSSRRERSGGVSMRVDSGDASGKIVLEADKLGMRFDDQQIIENFSTTILRGDRVAIIGPNGSGKSTLLKLLLDEYQPTSGSITRGTKLQIAYFDQEREQLDPERSVRDNVADGTDRIEIGGKSRHVIGYLNDFLFPPARVHSPVKTLSGGERNRLLLARLFTRPANLLVLDEPTNDLDVETLELLEELLADYEGTLLLVSHDRAFIDETVTSTLVINGTSVEEHIGGYSDWKRYADEKAAQASAISNKNQTKNSEPTKNKTANKTSANTPAKTTKSERRLSFNERAELKKLPALIESLEATQASLTQATTDPEFYTQDSKQVAEVMKQLSAASKELDIAYERWAELES